MHDNAVYALFDIKSLLEFRELSKRLKRIKSIEFRYIKILTLSSVGKVLWMKDEKQLMRLLPKSWQVLREVYLKDEHGEDEKKVWRSDEYGSCDFEEFFYSNLFERLKQDFCSSILLRKDRSYHSQ